MEQLVGYACVVCGQRIDSIVEGRFCEVCGSPVHNGCVKPDGTAPGACAGCGGERNGPAAQQVQSERSRRRRTAAATYPVSRVCPACGDSGFKRVAPERWVAYGSDRVCRACGTRYTPPTPLWAGVVFVIVGLVLLGFGLVGGVFSLLAVDVLALGYEGFLGLLGVLALAQGIRSLIRPGKA